MSEQKIDKDGNPIEEVVEDALTPEEELEKVKQERDTLLQTKDTLVKEIQEERKKKQLTEEEKKSLAEEKKSLADKIAELEGLNKLEDKGNVDVAKTVEQLLAQRDQKTRLKNKDKAMNAFLIKHPEFAPANDEAGLLKSALDRKIALFNTGTLEDESEFLSVYEDAYKLLGKKEKEEDDNNNVVINTPVTKKSPTSENLDKLQPKEIEYIEKHLGGNVERYNELKKNQPKAIEQILASESK